MALFTTTINPSLALDHQIQPSPAAPVSESAPRARHEIVCHLEGALIEAHVPAFLDIARIAVQRRYDARFIPMAVDTLRAAHEGPTSITSRAEWPLVPLHLVSWLSPAFREPISTMVGRRGLLWTSDIFRAKTPGARGIGPFAQHALFRVCAVLHLMARSDAHFHLIGDSTDVDPYVFLGIHYWSSRVLSDDGFERYLRAGGIDQATAGAVVRRYADKRQSRVASILIHDLERTPFTPFPPLTNPVLPFKHYLEVAIRWSDFGIIHPDHLWPLVRMAHNQCGLEPETLLPLLHQWNPSNPALAERRVMIMDRLRLIAPPVPAATPSSDLSPLPAPARSPLDESTLLSMVEQWFGQASTRGPRR